MFAHIETEKKFRKGLRVQKKCCRWLLQIKKSVQGGLSGELSRLIQKNRHKSFRKSSKNGQKVLSGYFLTKTSYWTKKKKKKKKKVLKEC